MTLVESYLKKNDSYKAKQRIIPKGIILYAAGVPQPGAKVFVNNWNRSGFERCMHAFVDANDGKVYQTLPWTMQAKHSNKYDTSHIAVMLCEPSQIKYLKGSEFEIVGNKENAIAMLRRTYESAVELVAQLCAKYQLDPILDVIASCDGNEKFSPAHLWNGFGVEYSMDRFHSDVTNELKQILSDVNMNAEDAKEESAIKEVSVNEIVSTVEDVKEPEDVFKPFEVRIDVPNLRIRTGPGTDCATTGKYTGKGTFVIDKVQNGTGSEAGWGHLASSDGWISLKYVTIL